MNIKDAKEQIKNAVTAYLTKDELGRYIIPPHKQRPVFLMGPPGIGKTAIMEQIASELGIGLLSYSMTHHTRQSALGLPLIKHTTYQGKEYDVSEYTMSEIIASVYDMMETSGIKNGILFLDEINCVSETLTPIMLQFLQILHLRKLRFEVLFWKETTKALLQRKNMSDSKILKNFKAMKTVFMVLNL